MREAGKPGDRMSRTVVLIPARMKATRLPNKPLASIAGEPMIVHVWRRAVAANIGPVIVACGEPEIAQAVQQVGGHAVLTDPDLASGTDRIWQALNRVDPDGEFERIVNLQGDLPTIDPADLNRVLDPIIELGTDMGTLAVATDDEAERASPDVVKAVVSFTQADPGLGRALYFTRATAPSGPGPVYHHIGIYAFTRPALVRFAGLTPSPLEQRERLEQLRALENGLTIGVRLVARAPFGVDTPPDLDRARRALEGAS